LAAVLPIAAADRYAAVLTDADVATLKHLAGTLPAGNHALQRVGEGRSRTVFESRRRPVARGQCEASHEENDECQDRLEKDPDPLPAGNLYADRNR
jgi:hypothetical protein